MKSTSDLQVKDLGGVALGTQLCSYDERDVMLYALAIGAGATELDLVYEKQLRVLPTFCLTLGLWAVWAAGALGAYDPALTLHVGQELRMRGDVPANGKMETTASIGSVWDKGSAALVEVNVSSEVFEAMYTIFIPGAGNFGGERGQRAAGTFPEGPADVLGSFETSVDQPALYRLTGDRHPVHIDPGAAIASGFVRPIMHGLCTLGSSILEIARRSGIDPTSLQQLTARLSAPVYPGATVNIEAWKSADDFYFSASDDSGVAAISGTGRFTDLGL